MNLIKVCIVDDDTRNTGEIYQILASAGVVDHSIKRFTCLCDLEDHCSSEACDLLILDLHVPKRAVDDPKADYAINYIKGVESGAYVKPGYIIGITDFSDSYREHLEFFNKLNISLINRADGVDWKGVIRTSILNLVRFAERYSSSRDRLERIDILAITALLQPEYIQLRSIGNSWKQVHSFDDTVVYERGVIEWKGKSYTAIIAYATQMGMAPAAVLCSKMLSIFSFSYIFMCGICAGIDRETIKLGDTIIVDGSWDYGGGKWVNSADGGLEFQPDVNLIPLDSALKTHAITFAQEKGRISEIESMWKEWKPSDGFSVHVGPMGSGSAVIQSKEIIRLVRDQKRKAIGLDMEAFGFMYSANQSYRPLPTFFCVKTVTDFADERKDDRVQKYGSFLSSRIALDFIDYISGI